MVVEPMSAVEAEPVVVAAAMGLLEACQVRRRWEAQMRLEICFLRMSGGTESAVARRAALAWEVESRQQEEEDQIQHQRQQQQHQQHNRDRRPWAPLGPGDYLLDARRRQHGAISIYMTVLFGVLRILGLFPFMHVCSILCFSSIVLSHTSTHRT